MLHIGFGRREVTPGLGTPLGGYAVPGRVATEIADPLHAIAMVVDDGAGVFVWIALDWVSIDGAITAQIREAVAAATGLAPETIHVTATHTHSAPNTLNFRCFGAIAQEYIGQSLPAIAGAVADALSHRRETRIGVAAIRSRTGVNRRAVSPFHDTRFEADPAGALDDTMTVLAFRSGAELTGILVHYGAHATAMGVSGAVSRDWPGVMKDRIESQFHVPVMFVNGALGDVGPRCNHRLGERGLSAGGGDGLDAVREVGYRAASDAIEALLSIREYRDGPAAVLSRAFELPYRPLPPRPEVEKLLQTGNPGEIAYAQMVLEAYRQPIRHGAELRAEALVLGPTALLLMPGELFADIALRLRRQSPYPYTLCCSLADENLAYLVTREARHRGGYEVEAGMYAGAYLPVENLDDILVETYTNLLLGRS